MTEELTIAGLRHVNFKTEDGKSISGLTLFCEYTSDRIEGYGVEKVFVSDNRLNGLQLAIGDVVSPIYNRYGKVAAVQLVD